jgi:tetratricopeptide (TPR) repeat protein
MGIKDYFKEELARDPLVRFGKRLFTGRKVTPNDTATWHFKQARSYMNYRSNKFDLRLAIDHLKEAISIMPQNPHYHCMLGQAFLLAPSFAVVRGDDGGLSLSRCVELAVKEFEKSIRTDPNYVMAYYYLAVSQEYLGQKEKAKEKCRAALKLSPKGELKNLVET